MNTEGQGKFQAIASLCSSVASRSAAIKVRSHGKTLKDIERVRRSASVFFCGVLWCGDQATRELCAAVKLWNKLGGQLQSRNNASRFLRNGSAERRGSSAGCTTVKWSSAENFLLFLLLGGLRSGCFFRGSLLGCSLLGCTFRSSLLRRSFLRGCLLGCSLLRCSRSRSRSRFFCCLLLRHCTSSVVIGLLSVPSRRLPVCLSHQRGDVADYVVRLACDHSEV